MSERFGYVWVDPYIPRCVNHPEAQAVADDRADDRNFCPLCIDCLIDRAVEHAFEIASRYGFR